MTNKNKPGNTKTTPSKPGLFKDATLDRGAYYQLAGTMLPAVYNFAESIKKPTHEKPIRNKYNDDLLNHMRARRYNVDMNPVIANINSATKNIRENSPTAQVSRAAQIAALNAGNETLRANRLDEFRGNQEMADQFYNTQAQVGAEEAAEDKRVYDRNLMHSVTRDNLRAKAMTQFGVGINDYGKQLANRDMNELTTAMMSNIYKNYGVAAYSAIVSGEVDYDDIIRFKGDVNAAKAAKAQKATTPAPTGTPAPTTTTSTYTAPGGTASVQTTTQQK